MSLSSYIVQPSTILLEIFHKKAMEGNSKFNEVSVQGFRFYFLICNYSHKQCLHYCVIQYMHEFNVFFTFHPTGCLK